MKTDQCDLCGQKRLDKKFAAGGEGGGGHPSYQPDLVTAHTPDMIIS
jgi:hypothetical protein